MNKYILIQVLTWTRELYSLLDIESSASLNFRTVLLHCVTVVYLFIKATLSISFEAQMGNINYLNWGANVFWPCPLGSIPGVTFQKVRQDRTKFYYVSI